jgi:hypothetical protein
MVRCDFSTVFCPYAGQSTFLARQELKRQAAKAITNRPETINRIALKMCDKVKFLSNPIMFLKLNLG